MGRRWLIACVVLIAGGLLSIPAAASADSAPLTVTVSPPNATEGQSFGAVVATIDDTDDPATTFTATIDWGDGSAPQTGFVSETNGIWTVFGTHTYTEEGTYTMSVTANDPDTSTGVGKAAVVVADGGLSLPAGTPTTYLSLSSFEAAIGGSDNGTTPGEQSGGYRHATWDDVALNGSDPGSTTITPNHVVSIAPNREQPRGIQLSRGVAVADDGFASVNPSVSSGTFPAASAPNIFAPYNSNRIQMNIVNPAARSSTSSPATTRGLGVTFLNVQQPGTTTIQYFSGTTLIGTATAPVGSQSFVGLLFPSPAVTQVVINLGSAAIFNFDGSTVTSGPSDVSQLVAADDVVLAEPQNPQTTIHGTAGLPVSGVLQSFNDTDANGKASDYTALVNWGDGTQSGAPVGGSGGLFSVSGSHTYMRQGTFQTTTSVVDFGGATQTNHVTVVIGPRSSTTSVSCSPSRVVVTHSTTCTATVSDVGGGTTITPTGTVGFNSSTGGVSFVTDTGCGLKPTATPGRSACSVVLTPGHYPPKKATVISNYIGDGAHTGSSASNTIRVKRQSCTVKLVSKRLSPTAKRLPIRVTCDMDALVTITVTATMPGQAKLKFAHLKSSVKAKHRKKINALIYPAGRRELRTASAGQRMTLKVTIVATPRTKPVTVTLTAKGVKVS